MRRPWLLPMLMGAVALAAGRPAGAQKAPRGTELPVGDNMKINTEASDAKPGAWPRVVVKSAGPIPRVAVGHTFVLVKAGAAPPGFVNAGLGHRGTGFIAPQM